MYAMGRFSIFTKLNNISTIYRKLVHSNVQNVTSAVACCNGIQAMRNYSISNEHKSKTNISFTYELINGKWVTSEHKENKSNSDKIERKQNFGLLSKTVDINIDLGLPPAVKRKDLPHFLSSIVYSNGNGSFRQCIDRLEKETSSHIKNSTFTQDF